MIAEKNLKTVSSQSFIAAYHSPLNLFMTNETLSDMKDHCQGTELESHQTAIIIFLLLPSDGLVRSYMTLSSSFSHKAAAFCTKQCTTPSLFHNLEVS